MKKKLAGLVIASLFSGTVMADAAIDSWETAGKAPAAGEGDTTTAIATWIAEVPVVLSGKWITFTGESGGTLADGIFEISPDGSFATTSPVVLELHYYDPDTGVTGDLVTLNTALGLASNDVKVGTLKYTVSQVDLASEKGSDITSASAAVLYNGTIQSTDVQFDANTNAGSEAISQWGIQNKDAGSAFGHIVAGDKITATTTVTADISFIAAP